MTGNMMGIKANRWISNISRNCCVHLFFVGILASHSTLAFSEIRPLTRIAVVNSDRILRESTPIQQAQARLEQEFSKRGDELSKMAQRLEAIHEKLENETNLSSTQRSQMQKELNQLNEDFQRKRRELSEEFNQRRNEEMAIVVDYANRVVQKIAQAEQYDLIVQDAVYFNPRIDITDQVLKALTDPKFLEK